mmetsp:Transcript_87480/g.260968  ORF Transcript_87480/g.260968 Transcript_87480/m.260968 type:complete len:613 (-) Transcript_87480:32-1870(-)
MSAASAKRPRLGGGPPEAPRADGEASPSRSRGALVGVARAALQTVCLQGCLPARVRQSGQDDAEKPAAVPGETTEALSAPGPAATLANEVGGGEEDDVRVRTLRVVYSSRDDTERLLDKLRGALESQGLDPSDWRPAGPPVYADANGPVQGPLNSADVRFPVTAEVKLLSVGDEQDPEDMDEDDSEAPSDEADSAEKGDENPFLTGVYTAPVMTEEELRRVSLPFSGVSERLRETLAEHGVAIVTDVIAEDELAALEAEFARDLRDLVDEEALDKAGPEAAGVREAYGQFRARGPRAFPVKDIKRVTAAAGFSVKNCLSHGRFAWSVRRHPNVKAVYQAIYPEAGALVSSMDVTFFTPEGAPAKERNRFSAHVDQNASDARPGLSEWESYQGVLYAWPSTPDGKCSTTVVWPGSHLTAWPEMMRDRSFGLSGKVGFHYSEISEMRDAALGRQLAEGWALHARRVVVPRGGLLLWNSRTVHTGWRGGPRLAQTVCFEPASRRPEHERLAKLRLAALGLPSTHWASAGMQHDMILGDAGYFAARRRARRGWSPASSRLPLRQAIRPVGLADGADLEALAKLVDVRYRLTGMWAPPPDVRDLLEASVRDDVKSLL